MGLRIDQLDEVGGWRPQPGDTVIGVVTDVDSGWSDWLNGSYPILTIEQDGNKGPISVHCFQTVLRTRVLSKRPQVGSRIGIKYHGKKDSADGKRVIAVYTVRVQGQSGSDPYAQFGVPAPDAPNNRSTMQEELPVIDDTDIPF